MANLSDRSSKGDKVLLQRVVLKDLGEASYAERETELGDNENPGAGTQLRSSGYCYILVPWPNHTPQPSGFIHAPSFMLAAI